jgi:phosphoglycolate phosphatase
LRLAAVLFDLDGTLVDTLIDIADAMNHALASLGLPTHRHDDYREWIGGGVASLVEHTVSDAARRGAVRQAFAVRYADALIVASAPYPGIPALLDGLAARGLPLAVVTNKPAGLADAMIQALLPGRFAAIVGQRDEVPAKPDPAMARAAAAALGVAPGTCALVGDTAIDIATARAAGMRSVGVAWGLRPAEIGDADQVIQRPGELLNLLQVLGMTET